MAGHFNKRKYKRPDGTTRVTWRARHPDPSGRGTDQIERSFATKTEAQAWLDRQSVALLDGGYVDPRKGERPLSEVADAWRGTWTELEPRTRAGYDHILRKHVLARFGDAKVGAVSASAIQTWVNELAVTRQPNTVRRIYTVLRSVLRIAVERGYVAGNACDAVRLPRKRLATSRARQLYLTAAEVRTLADAMPESWKLPVIVAALCGLRAGELWALRRRDVDPLHRTLTVAHGLKDVHGVLMAGPTKTHATRTMHLDSTLHATLLKALDAAALAPPAAQGYPVIRAGELEWTQDAADADRLLFTSPDGYPVRHGNFYRRVFKPTVVGDEDNKDPKQRRKGALPKELHGLRWHDLRHTAASLSLAVTPNLHVVKERLGHEDIRTTINIYGHLLPSVDAALADALGAMFDATARAVEKAPTKVRAIRERT
jgi:integrase